MKESFSAAGWCAYQILQSSAPAVFDLSLEHDPSFGHLSTFLLQNSLMIALLIPNLSTNLLTCLTVSTSDNLYLQTTEGAFLCQATSTTGFFPFELFPITHWFAS